MARTDTAVVRPAIHGIEINKVLRNTYILLALTLLFSALMAAVAMASNMTPLNPIITLVGYFALLFMIGKFRNSAFGLVLVFALTGLLGLTMGPILNYYMTAITNGNQIVMTALGGTGIIFTGLSAYVLVTRKDFSFIGGMIMAGMIVALLAIIVTLFWPMPALALAISVMIILLMSGLILFETSQIIHGGQTNYILATVSLYVAIYNIFMNLLMLLGIFSDD